MEIVSVNEDLISRQDAVSSLKGVIARTGLYGASIEIILANIPTVEAEPVVHAYWILRGGRRYCSACGTMACVTRDTDDFWYTVGTKRCPECGAYMDGEVTNAGK